jgi:hypothetical protein
MKWIEMDWTILKWMKIAIIRFRNNNKYNTRVWKIRQNSIMIHILIKYRRFVQKSKSNSSCLGIEPRSALRQSAIITIKPTGRSHHFLAHSFSHRSLFHWMIDWLIDWLNDWLIDWLIDRLIDWLIDWMIEWLNDWLIDWSIEWLNDSLIDWLTHWLIDWLIDRSIDELMNDWKDLEWIISKSWQWHDHYDNMIKINLFDWLLLYFILF